MIRTITRTTILLTLLALTPSSHAASAQRIEAICRPQASLTRPIRVGWDSLIAIDNVMFDGKDLKLSARFESAIEGSEKGTTDAYGPVDLASAQSMIVFAPLGSRELYFSSVQFGIREITAPVSAGPLPPGAYKATATLVLVSEFRKTPSADLQFTTTQIDLACAYMVKR